MVSMTTSFAIEGVTGDISKKVVDGFIHYQNLPGVHLSDKTLKWVKEHAKYDDDHPKVALEVIKKYAPTPKLQERVMIAARRSLQLLDKTLDTSYRAYAPAKDSKAGFSEEERRNLFDRRKEQVAILFPDRRFRETRNSLFEVVA